MMMRISLLFFCLLNYTVISQTILVSDGTWKGEFNSSATGGNAWMLQGFNDSSWPFVNCPNTGNAIPVVGTSSSMWVDNAASYSSIADTVYMRKTFTVPVGSSYTVNISINADNEFELYFNGATLGTANWWPSGPYVYTISPALQGCVENVIAVRAINWSGPAGASLSATITVNNPLTDPIAVAATNITCTSFTANWDSVPTATDYLLDVSSDPNFTTFFGPYQNFNTGNVLFHNISGINAGTTYYYRLRAVRGVLTSCYSNIITVSPSITVTVNSPEICVGQTATLIANGASSYTWTGVTTSAGNIATVSPLTTTSYTVTGITGLCSGTATSTVAVNDLPVPGALANIVTGCVPLCVQFTETSGTNCNSILYDFGDGTNTGSSSPLHCFSQTGIFSITITCTDSNTCTGTTEINNMITVSPLPVADFTSSPSDIAVTNSPVKFADVSVNGGDQLWNFGDPLSGSNNFSSFSNPTHTFSLQGTYCITLISTNAAACTDTTTKCIIVVDEATFLVPNVFTPNGDGNNDLFIISTTAVKELKCSIYNRWGIKMAEWDSLNGSWDGRTSSGNVAPDGVYYYHMVAIAINEKETMKEGFLQLVNDK